VRELPELEQVYRAHQAQGFLVVGITTSEDLEAAKKVVSDAGITFPVLVADSKVQDAFGGQGAPETFVIDRKGIVVEHIVGAQEQPFFEERATHLAAQ